MRNVRGSHFAVDRVGRRSGSRHSSIARSFGNRSRRLRRPRLLLERDDLDAPVVRRVDQARPIPHASGEELSFLGLVAVDQIRLPRIRRCQLARPADSLLPVLAGPSGRARLEVLVDVEHVDEDELGERSVTDDDDAVLVVAVRCLHSEVVRTEDDDRLLAPRVDHDDLAVRDSMRFGELQQLLDEVGELHFATGREREQRRATLAALGFDTAQRIGRAHRHEGVHLRAVVPDFGDLVDHRRVARIEHFTTENAFGALHQFEHASQPRRECRRTALLDAIVHGRLEVGLDDDAVVQHHRFVTLRIATAELERLLVSIRLHALPVVEEVGRHLSVADASHHVGLAAHARVRPVGRAGGDVGRVAVLVDLGLRLVVRDAPGPDHAVLDVRARLVQSLARRRVGEVFGAGVAEDEREVLEVFQQEVHKLVRAQLVQSLVDVTAVLSALLDGCHEHLRHVAHEMAANHVVRVLVVFQSIDDLLEVGRPVREAFGAVGQRADHAREPLRGEDAAREADLEGVIDLGGHLHPVGRGDQTLDGGQVAGLAAHRLELVADLGAGLAGVVEVPLALDRPNRRGLALPVGVGVLPFEGKARLENHGTPIAILARDGEAEAAFELLALRPVDGDENDRVVRMGRGFELECSFLCHSFRPSCRDLRRFEDDSEQRKRGRQRVCCRSRSHFIGSVDELPPRHTHVYSDFSSCSQPTSLEQSQRQHCCDANRHEHDVQERTAQRRALEVTWDEPARSQVDETTGSHRQNIGGEILDRRPDT